MKRTILLSIFASLLLLPVLSFAQSPVDYRDVAVIVNTNSKASVSIGNYFMNARKIPAANLIKFAGDTTESIDSTKFEAIRGTIETALQKLKGINYLVTTKGCPLKVDHGGIYCDQNPSTLFNTYKIIISWASQMNYSRCASFESELMLILGKYKSHIGMGDIKDISTTDSLVREHPYFEKKGHFSNAEFDIFLVTRLDAYTYADITNMINTSGANKIINRDSAQFIIDNFPYSIYADTMLLHSFFNTAQYLSKRGWKVRFDSTSRLIDSQKNVLGYFSWGYNDAAENALVKSGKSLSNKFLGASIASEFYSYSGKTFTSGATGFKATINPLFSKGLTSAITHVYEPYGFAMAEPLVLFGKYTDTTVARRFNMAESYYAASATMSWMTTIIGDPKTSIITHMPAMPAPTTDTITKVCKGSTRTVSTAGNLQGNYNWFSTDAASLKTAALPLDSTNPKWLATGQTLTIPATLAAGTYTYTYVNENVKGAGYKEIKFIVGACVTGVENESAMESSFDVYPNPAHDKFTISCKGLNNSPATIRITDALGRQVYIKSLNGVNDINEMVSLDKEPNGVYFITLSSNNQKLTKQIILK